MITSQFVKVVTTGGAGISAGANRVQFVGKILSIILFPGSSSPVTMDTVVTITENGVSTQDIETVASFTNSGDAAGIIKRYPRKEVDDGLGSSLGFFEPFITTTGIEVTVSEADDEEPAATIEVIYEE